MSFYTTFSLDNATTFVLSDCAPEILKAAAHSVGNVNWQNIAQGIISSRDSFNAGFPVTLAAGIGYLLTSGGQYLFPKSRFFTVMARYTGFASAVTMAASVYFCIDNINTINRLHAMSRGWDSMYPQFSLLSILNKAKVMNGVCS